MLTCVRLHISASVFYPRRVIRNGFGCPWKAVIGRGVDNRVPVRNPEINRFIRISCQMSTFSKVFRCNFEYLYIGSARRSYVFLTNGPSFMLLREFDYTRPSMATVTIIREYGGWDPLLYEARTQMDQAGFRVNVDGYGRSGRALRRQTDSVTFR